jgi:hypothetical protein
MSVGCVSILVPGLLCQVSENFPKRLSGANLEKVDEIWLTETIFYETDNSVFILGKTARAAPRRS